MVDANSFYIYPKTKGELLIENKFQYIFCIYSVFKLIMLKKLHIVQHLSLGTILFYQRAYWPVHFVCVNFAFSAISLQLSLAFASKKDNCEHMEPDYFPPLEN